MARQKLSLALQLCLTTKHPREEEIYFYSFLFFNRSATTGDPARNSHQQKCSLVPKSTRYNSCIVQDVIPSPSERQALEQRARSAGRRQKGGMGSVSPFQRHRSNGSMIFIMHFHIAYPKLMLRPDFHHQCILAKKCNSLV